MTLDLIRKKQIDSNDYELWLKKYGYTELDENLRQDILAICKFFYNEELVLQGLKKLAEQYLDFNKTEKSLCGNFLIIGEIKIILIIRARTIVPKNLQRLLISSSLNILPFYLVN
ncbi:helicase [Legionella sainthelensi]|uniref:Helicase n=1 Tax=Legionella sainthelensi TaxID=28087 RepID=A0A0W0YC45_9GAMM|nr:helicase [Legionella sainthelensi]VEH33432.1 helicase [Legionella sainthelensi]